MLIKLMGWMPAPLDLSVWHSLWALEKSKDTAFNLRRARIDFEFGYWGTMVMGFLFLGLGAVLIYGSQTEMPVSGVAFASVLIDIYSHQLGDWAFYVVGIAAFATMVSTTLTCIDAIPRSLEACWKIGFKSESSYPYPLFLILLGSGSFALLAWFSPSMTSMVDLATVLSFCSTPVLAFMNYKVMRGTEVPEEYRPKAGQTAWELMSIALLSLLTILFLLA
jgi:Mn2+/Fe2+ NRAMP family transporter